MKRSSILCVKCNKSRITGVGTFAELADREGWGQVANGYQCPDCQEGKPKRKTFLIDNEQETTL